jgi:serine/threonine-protein kinase
VRSFKFDFDDPVMVQACHSVGAGVQMYGEVTASSGALVTVRLALLEGGRTVGGPHTCGLRFDQGRQTDDCGPRTVSARRGHRYTVVVTWQYSRHGRSLSGQAPGREFTF